MLKSRKRIAAVIVLLLIPAAWWGLYSDTAICDRCGALKNSGYWQVPFTQLTYFESSRVKATPLSDILDTRGIRKNHQHQWLTAHGSGNGVTCAIGRGRHIYQNANAPISAAFIQALLDYESKDAAMKFTDAILDTSAGHNSFSIALGLSKFPTSGFSSKMAFDAWWSEHKADLNEDLEQRASLKK